MRPRALALLALALAGPLALSGCLTSNDLVGAPAPAFTLVTSEGETVNETTYRGRYLILDLMATWCGPCVLEVAHLREVQARYGDRVAILSVGIDPSFDDADSLDAFAQKYGANWPHALDAQREVAQAYRLGIVPKLVVVDPEGVVVFEAHGEVPPAAIARAIDPSAAPPPGGLALPVLVGLGLGFLAVFNPYRRFHEVVSGARAEALAGILLGALALLAWRFLDVAGSRATYGSLLIGAVSLGAVLWWARARTRTPPERAPGRLPHAALDRAYEGAPHFAFVLVLGLQSTGWVAFFAPVAAFLVGAGGAVALMPRLPERERVRVGLLGLLLAALGLLLFGARILVVEAA